MGPTTTASPIKAMSIICVMPNLLEMGANVPWIFGISSRISVAAASMASKKFQLNCTSLQVSVNEDCGGKLDHFTLFIMEKELRMRKAAAYLGISLQVWKPVHPLFPVTMLQSLISDAPKKWEIFGVSD